MSDDKKHDDEALARTFATVYRMSQLLNLPLEDCARIFCKIAAVIGDKKTH